LGVDYRDWTARAASFVRRLANRAGVEVRAAEFGPSQTAAELDRIERSGLILPAALRRFLTEGSGTIDFRYVFEPELDSSDGDRLARLSPDQSSIYGGVRIVAAELPDLQRSAMEWARDTWVAEDQGQQAIWACALPFAALDNGDFLALDVSTPEDPPVIYLSHDDESIVLAPSFNGFLAAWERLCYLGPEIWLLERFRGEDGFLDGGSAEARELRALLAVETK
jgi:hypothetical protein